MAVKYMHTLNGRPAYYVPGQQIVYHGGGRNPIPLAGSLKQIKAEQRASRTWRNKRGLTGWVDHGHLRVAVG